MWALVLATAMAGVGEEVAAVAAWEGVPEAVLAALVWHGSRFDPELAEGWGAFGPLGLRDEQVALAAAASSIGPDRVAHDVRANLVGGAALLRQQATLAVGSAPVDVDDWLTGLPVFSGSHDPEQRSRFVALVRSTLADGLDERAPTGELVRIAPQLDVDAEPDPIRAGFPGACSRWRAARRPEDITQIVVHTTQGRYAGTLDWFRRCSGVSAHYVIRAADGEVTQAVDTHDIAFHAGNRVFNAVSIGIEHEGWVQAGRRWYTEAMYRSSARLVAGIVVRTGVEADREHIRGHAEVPGARHGDPGRAWDWDRYLGYIREEIGRTEIVVDVRGQVRVGDPWVGQAVADAVVWLDGLDDPVVTDSDGTFAFPGLPPGTWTASALAPGYGEASCTVASELVGSAWCTIVVEADPVPDVEDVPASRAGGWFVRHGDAPSWPLVLGPLWVVGRRRGRLPAGSVA